MFIVIEWHTRQIVDYEVSYTSEKEFVLRCLRRALCNRKPEIINSDQGSHFTNQAYLDLMESCGSAEAANEDAAKSTTEQK